MMKTEQKVMRMEQRLIEMEPRPGVGDDSLHLFESLHTLITVATGYLMRATAKTHNT